jgi:hypothetical protein
MQACGGDFESICTENNAKREEAYVLQNSCNSNSNCICGLHCLGRSNIRAITCASKRTDQVTLFASIHRFRGELKLPENSIWRVWVFVGEPLTPNALNGGQAGFPEYHNVYIEPGSYDIYRKTGIFPDGTIFFKELQLTLPPAENPDGSRTEPSGRGYFPARSMARM